MATWLEDIAQYLEDSTTSIGIYSPTTTETRTIYLNNMPSTADSFIVLYPYAGMAPDWSHDNDSFRRPRLNVLVVSTAADGGHQKSIDIRKRLDHVHETALPSSTAARHYLLIEGLGEPEYLGKDATGRGQFVTNYQIKYISMT